MSTYGSFAGDVYAGSVYTGQMFALATSFAILSALSAPGWSIDSVSYGLALLAYQSEDTPTAALFGFSEAPGGAPSQWLAATLGIYAGLPNVATMNVGNGGVFAPARGDYWFWVWLSGGAINSPYLVGSLAAS
jgi:hypothetical protein